MLAIQNQTPELLGIAEGHRDAAARAMRFMMNNFSSPLSLEDVAEAAGTSKFSLCRQFLRRYRSSPMRWLWALRVHVAAEHIARAPSWSLTALAFACGFSSSAHFSRAFRHTFGEAPSTYRSRLRERELFGAPLVTPAVDHKQFSAFFAENAPAVVATVQKTLMAQRA